MALSDNVFSLDGMSVTFGGFGPTPQKDMEEAVASVLESYEKMAEYRQQRLDHFSREADLTSERKSYTDENGVIWDYVIYDQTEVRIAGYESDNTTIVIPAEIEGTPVYALLPDACARHPHVEEIICPDCIQSIGSSAFRLCDNLKRLVLPEFTAEFDRTWIQRCPKLEEIVMPGMLERIDSGVFENPDLKSLVVGIRTAEFAHGMFDKGHLERISINENNPHFVTDGVGVFSRDLSTFVALAVRKTEYEVATSVKTIAKKAFHGMDELERIVLPEGLEEICEFAFCKTGLTSISIPSTVKHIGEKAFFKSRGFKHIELQEGLESIATDAFTDTSLEELCVPASIVDLGHPLAEHTKLVCSGPEATLSIADGSEELFLDMQGGLYRNADDGLHFVRMVEPAIESYAFDERTKYIDEQSFFRITKATEVTIPDSVVSIGRAAFSGCTKLAIVNMGESVERIEMDAFLDTALEKFYIPASVEFIGAKALITNGAHHGKMAPSLRKIVVAEGNSRFYTEPGLLCERIDDESARIVVYTGEVPSITVPDNITEIASYAFNGTRLLSELIISTRVARISMCALTVDCVIEHLHIDLVEPIEGHDFFDLHFPDTNRAAVEISNALGSAYDLNLPEILRHYDNAIVNTYSIGPNNNGDIYDLYEQSLLIIERLKDPLYMTDSNKSLCTLFIENHIGEICVAIARHDDRSAIDDLVDLEFLNAENISDIIDAVGKLQDAAMTGYLLEVKRRRMSRAVDFSLDFEL